MSAPGQGRQVLLVLGMHRAGTSALARVASLLGAGLPAHLMPGNPGNPSGYWEPARIVEFNDRLLRHHGLQWDDPFATFSIPPASRIPAAFHEEAARLVDEEFGDAPLFVLKDPRCTLLADFWRHVLERKGIAVAPVVVMRPPDEVVASLRRRDGADPVASALLYVGHAIACAAFGGTHRAAFVTYAQLLDDWRGVMGKVAETHAIRWPVPAPAAASAVDGFLAPASAPQPVDLPVEVGQWAAAAWRWMRDRAEGRTPDTDLAKVEAAMRSLSALVGPVLTDRTRRQVAADESVAAERDRLVGERDRSHALFEGSQAELSRAASARDKATRERDRAHALFESSQADLARAASARDAAMQERDRAHALFEESQAALSRTAAGRDAAIADRDRVHAMLEESQATLSRTAADRDAAIADRDHIRARHDASVAELAVTAAERDAGRMEVERLSAAHDELHRQHMALCALHEAALQSLHDTGLASERLQQQLAERQGEIDTMLASHSWRLTRPLRAARRWVGRLARSGRGLALPTGTGLSTSAEGQAAAAGPLPSGPAATGAGSPSNTVVPASLQAFLVEEFGSRQAQQVVAGIEAHRLPVEVGEVRPASRAACDPDEAVATAHALAALAGPDIGGDRAPDVSIVVPVYNQLRFTLACLHALLRHRSRYRFEILVGDDASTDATAQALAVPIAGVRHVRNEGNLGFVRNCNATAAHARGRHVVFLNNDTIVLPGWLDELVGTLDRDPRIGLAGSKLVFPDGRLQECGGIVWRDGSAWNFGRLDDPRRPEYCYLRDVDYVSGASIALPRDLWQRLGGFDELFAPAYAEDADLAFRVRAQGLRTVVQPLSQLLHFEGITSGTDTTQGAKAYQVRNLGRLRERWADVLAGHRDNADSPELEKERQVRRRVLFVDHCTPTPNADAGSLVAWEVMAAFQRHGYKVTFIPEDNFAHMGADTADLQRVGIEPIYHPAYSFMSDFLAARHDPFDVIFLHRYKVADVHLQDLRKRFPGAKVVFLNADMHFLREMREAEMAGDERAMERARKTRRRELAVVRDVDYALVHSEVELDLLRKDCPDAATALFPLIQDPVDQAAPLRDRDGACFVGGFRHPPNADGIGWFVREAWPRVLAARPDAVLYIAGSNMTPEVEALGGCPGVEVVGYVDDLPAFFARRRVAVAPLRYGAGAKGKVATAMAHGLPNVCTTIAAEGMQLEAGRNVLVADAPDALADAVVSLLASDESWTRMSEASLAYADAVTARRHAHDRIGQVLEALGLR